VGKIVQQEEKAIDSLVEEVEEQIVQWEADDKGTAQRK
jgi:hypothetical protein